MLSVVSGTLALVSVKGFATAAPRGLAVEGVGDSELDDSQRSVLDVSDDASVAVLGAPGTGKTTTLVSLVADRVLARGWLPDELVVLAPSRSAATRLRDRLAVRLSVPTKGPIARTVNSLAFDIVRHARASAGLEPPRLLTGGDQDSDLSQLLSGHLEEGTGPTWPEPLGPEVRAMRGFRTELRELLMRATEYDIGPDRLRALAAEHARPEWAAAADFQAEYLQVMAQHRPDQLDSAELVQAACQALQSDQVADSVAPLRLVVVDDLHDATRSTLKLLRAIAARGAQVIAFGNPDVAVNAFRGSEPDVLVRLGEVLNIPALPPIHLRTSHRQSGSLLALTSAITDRIGTARTQGHRHPASAVEDSGGAIVKLTATTPGREWTGVAHRLREEHLHQQTPWNDMAVVVRSGGLVPVVARALALANVPTRTAVGGAPLRDDLAVRELLALVDSGLGRSTLTAQLASELLLGAYGGLDRLDLRRLRLALRAEELAGGGTRGGDALLVDALSDPARLATIDHRAARRAVQLATTLKSVDAAAKSGATIEELLWLVWDRSGLAGAWRAQALGAGILATEANRNLDGVLALFTAAKRFVERDPDSPASEFLDQVLDREVPDDTLSPQSGADAVLVATPSGVAGLEFATVVVAGLQEGVWPNLRLRGSLLYPGELSHAVEKLGSSTLDARKEVRDDELRMFALAVSRARHQVILASVSNDDDAESVFLSLVPDGAEVVQAEALPSLSLRGLVGRLRRDLVSASGGARSSDANFDAAAALALLAGERVPGASPDEWHGLLNPSTTEALYLPDETVGISPSKIEAIDDSPMDWFIESVSGGDSSNAMGIGTIVHAAMEAAADPSVEALWAIIESRWSELEFEAPWVAVQARRTVRTLVEAVSEYLVDFERSGGTLVGAERRFTLEFDRARLNGSIDRVERRQDGSIVIVDLKTGAPVTNQDDVDANAQLSAYQLAYATGVLDDALREFGPHHAGGAKLLFVKSGVRGKRYREGVQAPLETNELEQFVQTILRAVNTMSQATFAGSRVLDPWGRGDTPRRALHRVRAVSSD